MNLLITGGTGMLGRAFVQKYSEHYTLTFTGRNAEVGKRIEQETGSMFLPLDLEERGKLTEACNGVDGIIHCAALSSPWGKKEDFIRTNVIGTRNLLDAAERCGINTFIHISTPSLYFAFRDQFKIKETTPLPRIFCNQYASSKAQAERIVLKRFQKSIILRPRGIFGPHDTSIVPRILQAVRNGTLWLPSTRNPLIDMTYVENVADAIHLALAKRAVSQNIFNITNGEPTHVLDILRQLFASTLLPIRLRTLPYGLIAPVIRLQEDLRKLIPSMTEPRLTRYSAAMFHYHQTLDISKAKKILGYTPKISLAEGIERYGHWYKGQNL